MNSTRRSQSICAVNLVRVDAAGNEERRGGDGSDERRVQAHEKAGEHASRHDADP